MHDEHEPTCLYCVKYVMPFDHDSPLEDWGYCQEEAEEGGITHEKLKEIEAQVQKGDYSFLTNRDIPLYEFSDEGCKKFKHR